MIKLVLLAIAKDAFAKVQLWTFLDWKIIQAGIHALVSSFMVYYIVHKAALKDHLEATSGLEGVIQLCLSDPTALWAALITNWLLDEIQHSDCHQ